MSPGSQSAAAEAAVLSDLRGRLERSEEDKVALETQLSGANGLVTQLQEDGITGGGAGGRQRLF